MTRRTTTRVQRPRWRIAALAGAVLLLFAGCIEGNPDPYAAEEREPTGPGGGPGVDPAADEEEDAEDQDARRETAARDGGPEGSDRGVVVFILAY